MLCCKITRLQLWSHSPMKKIILHQKPHQLLCLFQCRYCFQNVFFWTKIFCNRIKLVEKSDKEKQPLEQYSQEEGIPFQLVHTRPLDKTHTELNYVDHTHYSAAQLPDQPGLHSGPKYLLKLHDNSYTNTDIPSLQEVIQV